MAPHPTKVKGVEKVVAPKSNGIGTNIEWLDFLLDVVHRV